MVESGTFYSTIIDPILGPMRKRVTEEIITGEKVIDIACGTGAQLFDIAGIASTVTGVDLSESMIRYANKLLQNYENRRKQSWNSLKVKTKRKRLKHVSEIKYG